MNTQIKKDYVLTNHEASQSVNRAIEIVKLANAEQVKKILAILDSRID